MKKRTLRKNLYLLFIVSITLPVLLISSFFELLHNRQVEEQENQHIGSMLRMESSDIYSYLNEIEKISSAPYLYNDIYSLMLRMKSNSVSSADPNQINLYDLTYLKLIYNCPDAVQNIAFYPASDNDDTLYLLSRSHGELQCLKTSGYFTESWFSDAQEANGDIVISGIRNSIYPNQRATENVITLTRAIKDFDTQKSIGVLKVDVSSRKITDLVKNFQTTEHSRAVLFNQRNSLICTSGTVSEEVLSQLKTASTTLKDNDDIYSVEETGIPEYGWKLIYLSSRKDLLASTAKFIFFSIAITLTAIIVAFVLYSQQSKKILVSVKKIVSTIRQLGSGNLSAKADIENRDELSLISNALDQMSEQLNEHIEREYKATISQKNAEYMALQSQINPHFFYNTLNGFLSLNRMGEQELLEKSIVELTHLFRYTCSGEKITRVKEEFGFLSEYLELQKLKFEERLNFTIDLEGKAGEELIPKLLLQPIVENSIVHGMEPREQPIHISVKGRLVSEDETGEVLELLVQDDGVGFDVRKIAKTGSRVGLKNVEERLHYFRAFSQFRIQSSATSGTVCMIRIPVEGEQDPDSGTGNDMEEKYDDFDCGR